MQPPISFEFDILHLNITYVVPAYQSWHLCAIPGNQQRPPRKDSASSTFLVQS
jgi:hypothetical protein